MPYFCSLQGKFFYLHVLLSVTLNKQCPPIEKNIFIRNTGTSAMASFTEKLQKSCYHHLEHTLTASDLNVKCFLQVRFMHEKFQIYSWLKVWRWNLNPSPPGNKNTRDKLAISGNGQTIGVEVLILNYMHSGTSRHIQDIRQTKWFVMTMVHMTQQWRDNGGTEVGW